MSKFNDFDELTSYYDYMDEQEILRQLKEEEGWITEDPEYLEFLEKQEQITLEKLREEDE